MKNIDKPDTQNIGNAGEYFVASVLSANGFITTITLGRAEAYDIIAISPKTKKAIKIQVKTSWSQNGWQLSEKDEKSDDDQFYIFVNLNEFKKCPEYWVFESRVVSKYLIESHNSWLITPGKYGQKHNPTKMRKFIIKKDDHTPIWFDEKYIKDKCKEAHNNINIILEIDKM